VLQLTEGNVQEVTDMNIHPFAAVHKLCLEKFTLHFLTKASVVIWTECTGNFRFSFLAIPDKNFRPLQYMQLSVDYFSSECPDKILPESPKPSGLSHTKLTSHLPVARTAKTLKNETEKPLDIEKLLCSRDVNS
jgi:hypothetical protein